MKEIDRDLFLKFKFLGQIKKNSEETSFAFVTAEADLKENQYKHTLYIEQLGSIKRTLNLKKQQAFTYISQDVLLINLQKTKKEEIQLKEQRLQSMYYYHIKDQTLKKAFDLPFPCVVEEVIDANTLLISAQLTPEDQILYAGTKDERLAYIKERKESSLYEDIECLPYYMNGKHFTNRQVKQLFIFKLDALEIFQLLNETFSYGLHYYSKNDQTIYFSGKQAEDVLTFTSKIYAYDIKHKTYRIIYNELDYQFERLFVLDQQLFVTAKDMVSYGMNQNYDFYLVKDGNLSLLHTHGESLGNTIGTDSRFVSSNQSFTTDDAHYFLTTIDDHVELRKLSLKEGIQTIYQAAGGIDGIMMYQENIVGICMLKQKLQEVYQIHIDTQTVKPLTRLNQTVLKNHYVAKPKTFIVKKKTHEVKGFALLPKDFNKDQTYPMILNIHGGPKTVYGQIYYHEMQYWANQGYIVIFSNPRGSDGKGNAFADIRGKYGTIDYEDLMDFVHLVQQKIPQIDQKRMCVTGGSYGGFMTNWIIGQSDMFKVAATQRSISNWVSFYGTSDIGYYFATDQVDGHPILDMEKLYDQSPIKYALQIKTPLLIIHSDQDHRCPIEQAQQLYAILKTQGVKTRFIWFKEENHELSRSGKPKARIKRLEEITSWFNQHIN